MLLGTLLSVWLVGARNFKASTLFLAEESIDLHNVGSILPHCLPCSCHSRFTCMNETGTHAKMLGRILKATWPFSARFDAEQTMPLKCPALWMNLLDPGPGPSVWSSGRHQYGYWWPHLDCPLMSFAGRALGLLQGTGRGCSSCRPIKL